MRPEESERTLPWDSASQSTRLLAISDRVGPGPHVGVIMDGNGRWAERRGLPRPAGHRAGARAVRTAVEAARRADVASLTLYAFSSDNWERPRAEVTALMRLLRRSLAEEAERCRTERIRLEVIGRRDRLPVAVVNAIEEAEELTAGGDRMLLRLAVDYSSRGALEAAFGAALMAMADAGETLAENLRRTIRARTAVDRVDLIVRTGGEQRLSDFLLWEAAYAELFFTPTLWPDFDAADFREALAWFAGRSRRFGRLGRAAATAGAEA